MTTTTAMRIKAFAKDKERLETIQALLSWYGVNSLDRIPESAALEFLSKLESGEIRMQRED